jgi:hypothetical protein
MASIRDYAVTIYTTATASMVCEMPEHQTGDLLVAFVNKDTASNFTTPSGWTAQQTQVSAGAGGGVYTKRAASSSETVTFALTIETCNAVIVAVRNANGSTDADAVSGSAKSGADDSTLPLTGVGITPSHNNCLILHGLSTDSGIGPSAAPGWVNLFVGDATANSLCVAYTAQRTAGAITAPDHWAAAADDSRGFIIAIRDDGNDTRFPAYIAPGTTPARLISPLVFASTPDRGTWELTTNDITTVAGKTMGQVDAVAATDSGYNPFRAALRVSAASSTTNLTASEMRFTAAEDLTGLSGVVFGTYRFQVPRDYLDAAKPSNGGAAFIMFADAENDYKAWVVAAQFAKSTDASNRQNYAVQVQGSSDTSYATSGTIGWSAINDLYLGGAGYYGACAVEWSDLYLLNETVLAGGTATTPMDFDEIVDVVNRGSGFIPLMVQSGAAATVWTRLRFGGVDPFHAAVNLRTFQYPRKADEVDYLDFHVDNNHMGIEFYGLANDTLAFTNCTFTSDSPYYWRFNASHSGSANIDFSGSTVVNATVTLRSTSDLDRVTFIDCPTFTQNSAALSNCAFDNTKVSSAAPADAALITDSSFTSAGTGHAIEIGGTAANITLDGLTFTGYAGTNGSTGNEAIYVNIASGSMTISIQGGSTPSIRTAGATVTVQNAVTVKVTAKDADTAAAIQSARVLLKAASGATVTITRASSTASVSHTAHGYSTGQKVVIAGANEGEYNGLKTITVTGANGYDYTVSGTPATPATGTITSYRVVLDGDTNASGIVQDTAFNYTADLAVDGKVRKGTSSTYYKTSPLSGTIATTGLDLTAFLVKDT